MLYPYSSKRKCFEGYPVFPCLIGIPLTAMIQRYYDTMLHGYKAALLHCINTSLLCAVPGNVFRTSFVNTPHVDCIRQLSMVATGKPLQVIPVSSKRECFEEYPVFTCLIGILLTPMIQRYYDTMLHGCKAAMLHGYNQYTGSCHQGEVCSIMRSVLLEKYIHQYQG